MKEKTNIVVVGGGFSGIYTCIYLLKSNVKDQINVTLITKTNYFLFTPMLHEVATGGLNQNLIATPIREILDCKNVNVITDEVNNVDLEDHVVNTNKNTYKYDYLVLATGSKTNYYNIPGAKENSIGLKNLKDSEKIKNKILYLCEHNDKFSISIVGGGPTGVELAVEIKQYITDLCKLYNKNTLNISINLITQDACLVSRYSKKIQQKVLNFVKQLNINIYLNTMITRVESNFVISNDNKIASDLILWTAGVAPSTPKIFQNVKKSANGQLVCDAYLRLKSYTNVYAGGDIVDGYYMLAQTATKHAKFIATNISNSIQKKKLVEANISIVGTLLSLGQKKAVGQIFNINLFGIWVWFLWRTIYLLKTPKFNKKIKIAINWTFNLFTHRDSSRY